MGVCWACFMATDQTQLNRRHTHAPHASKLHAHSRAFSRQPATRQQHQHLVSQMGRCLVLVTPLHFFLSFYWALFFLLPIILLPLHDSTLGPWANPTSSKPTSCSPAHPSGSRWAQSPFQWLSVSLSGRPCLPALLICQPRTHFLLPPHLATYQERQPPAHHVHATGTSARTTRCLLTRHPITITHAFNLTTIPIRHLCH